MSASLIVYGLKAWLWPYRRRYLSNLKHPLDSQERILSQIINKLVNTKYGLLFNVTRKDTYSEFCKKVPIVSYEKLKHWIERQKSHETNILVDEPVMRYEYIQDSSLIPYTKSLENSFYQLFAIQLASAQLPTENMADVLAFYKAHWSGSPGPLPKSLLTPLQSEQTQAPIFVKLPECSNFLPLLTEVFFEFLDSNKTVFRLHEIELGQKYSLVITQKSGLYRYKMGINVKVCEFFKNTPSFQVIP